MLNMFNYEKNNKRDDMLADMGSLQGKKAISFAPYWQKNKALIPLQQKVTLPLPWR